MNTLLQQISQGRKEHVSAAKATLISLGLDVHVGHYAVVGKLDGQRVEPITYTSWGGNGFDPKTKPIPAKRSHVTICPTWSLNRLSLKPIHNRTHSRKLASFGRFNIWCAPFPSERRSSHLKKPSRTEPKAALAAETRACRAQLANATT